MENNNLLTRTSNWGGTCNIIKGNEIIATHVESNVADEIVLAVNNYEAIINLLSTIVAVMALEKVERYDLQERAKELLLKATF